MITRYVSYHTIRVCFCLSFVSTRLVLLLSLLRLLNLLLLPNLLLLRRLIRASTLLLLLLVVVLLLLLLVMLPILLQFEGSYLRERNLNTRRGCFRARVVPFDDTI